MGNVNVAVIGARYWVPSLLRVLSSLDGARVVAVGDRNLGRLRRATDQQYSQASVFAIPTIEDGVTTVLGEAMREDLPSSSHRTARAPISSPRAVEDTSCLSVIAKQSASESSTCITIRSLG